MQQIVTSANQINQGQLQRGGSLNRQRENGQKRKATGKAMQQAIVMRQQDEAAIQSNDIPANGLQVFNNSAQP